MKKIITILSLGTFALANSFSFDSVGINLGASSLPYSHENQKGSIILTDKIKESVKSLELYSTFKTSNALFKKYNLKHYTSFTYSSNDDFKHQFLLTGINKYYLVDKTSFYTGVLLGYGQIDWKRDPLNSSKIKNTDANSFITGIQLGLSYPINKKISLGLDSKFLVHDYETFLEPNSSTKVKLEQDYTSSISFNLKYSFLN